MCHVVNGFLVVFSLSAPVLDFLALAVERCSAGRLSEWFSGILIPITKGPFPPPLYPGCILGAVVLNLVNNNTLECTFIRPGCSCPGRHLYLVILCYKFKSSLISCLRSARGCSGTKFKCKKLRPMIFLQLNCLANPLENLLAHHSLRN